MNKNLIYLSSAIAAAAALASCSEADAPPAADESVVRFALEVPDAIEARAGDNTSSAAGGLTNVDMALYDLRYQLAIYTADGEQVIAPRTIVTDAYQPVSYEVRLTPNRSYRAVVWADFVPQGTSGDHHYDTSDFANIRYADAHTVSLNDESRDAYFVTKPFDTGTAAVSQSLTLRRPFAKVRMVTTDWASEGLEMPDRITVNYYGCTRFTSLNSLTGEATGETLGDKTSTETYEGTLADEKEYKLNYDANPSNRTLFVDYLLTHVKDQTPAHLEVAAFNGTDEISRHDLRTNIPLRRNWLTTIIGNSLSVGGSFDITIDEAFENEIIVGEEWWNPQGLNITEPPYDPDSKTYTVTTRDQFAWFAAEDPVASAKEGRKVQNAESLAGKTIDIRADIDMSGIDWQPIFTEGYTEYKVHGNGHTLRNFSVNGKFGTVYVYEKLGIVLGRFNAYSGIWGKFIGEMKDLNFENITIHGRAGDTVHTDIEGNLVDHSKETSYFAGVIGFTGRTGSSPKVNISNCHVTDIDIDAAKGTTAQNIGGFIGWIGSGGGDTWVKDCTVTRANLIGGSQVGGLVGQILSGREVTIRNCATSDIRVHHRGKYSKLSMISGFVGQINNGAGMRFFGCKEPVNVRYFDDATGAEVTDYIPAHPLYGHCSKNSGKITITD